MKRARVGRTIAVVSLLACLAASGCGSSNPSGPTGADRRAAALRAQLAASERRWAERGLPAYEFRYQRSCYCVFAGTLQVTVVDGRVVGAADPETGAFLPSERRPPDATVEGLFAAVRDAIDRRRDLDVVYDPERGFPRRIAIDARLAASDGAVFYTAGDLRPFSYIR